MAIRLFHYDSGAKMLGVEVGKKGWSKGDGPGGHGLLSWRLRATLRDGSALGQAAANAMRIRVAVSVMCPAIVSGRRREVVNSAVASG